MRGDAGPSFVAGDMHLGAVPGETEEAFIAWLDRVAEEGASLLLTGDVFDFWFEYRRVVLREHFRVLAKLASVVEAGVPVTYVGGNHDWWGGSFLEEEVGVDFHRDPVVVELAGRRALVAHGDGLGRGDVGYRLLRLLLRGRLTRRAFRAIHPDLGARIGDLVSDTGTELGREAPTEASLARARVLEGWARDRLAEDPGLDAVILGHTHVPAVEEVEPRRYYLNAGGWLKRRSYLVLEEGQEPRLERWEGG